MKFNIVLSYNGGQRTDVLWERHFCSYKAAEKAFLKSRVNKYPSFEEYNNRLVENNYFHRYFINEV
jgi:hypothetical protein